MDLSKQLGAMDSVNRVFHFDVNHLDDKEYTDKLFIFYDIDNSKVDYATESCYVAWNHQCDKLASDGGFDFNPFDECPKVSDCYCIDKEELNRSDKVVLFRGFSDKLGKSIEVSVTKEEVETFGFTSFPPGGIYCDDEPPYTTPYVAGYVTEIIRVIDSAKLCSRFRDASDHIEFAVKYKLGVINVNSGYDNVKAIYKRLSGVYSDVKKCLLQSMMMNYYVS